MQAARQYLLDYAHKGAEVREKFFVENAPKIILSALVTTIALSRGKKLLLCGNGGSAADAQHIAAEFVNRFLKDRPALPAIALTTDSSVLSSIANDYSFEQIFARQVEALGRPGDVLFAISTSGKSPNVLRAIAQARKTGI